MHDVRIKKRFPSILFQYFFLRGKVTKKREKSIREKSERERDNKIVKEHALLEVLEMDKNLNCRGFCELILF